jgi:hypothetical protein
MQQCIKILLFLTLNEVQHVSGDTPSIIRSLKLVGCCQVAYATWQRPTTAHPTTYYDIMQNQRLLVQFYSPDDGRCVVRNMLLDVRQPSTILCKTGGCLCSFKLLMMGGVSPETCCWTSDNLPRYYAKPEAAYAVLSSWWWAVCRPKHVVGRCQVAYATWQRPTTARTTTFHDIIQNPRLLVQF